MHIRCGVVRDDSEGVAKKERKLMLSPGKAMNFSSLGPFQQYIFLRHKHCVCHPPGFKWPQFGGLTCPQQPPCVTTTAGESTESSLVSSGTAGTAQSNANAVVQGNAGGTVKTKPSSTAAAPSTGGGMQLTVAATSGGPPAGTRHNVDCFVL